jgi:hypothetical protein
VLPVEESSGEVRVVSTGERKEFRKRDGRAEQFVELLRSMGEIPADQEPILDAVRETIKELRVARLACHRQESFLFCCGYVTA